MWSLIFFAFGFAGGYVTMDGILYKNIKYVVLGIFLIVFPYLLKYVIL